MNYNLSPRTEDEIDWQKACSIKPSHCKQPETLEFYTLIMVENPRQQFIGCILLLERQILIDDSTPVKNVTLQRAA
ncbi:MAG: hypothetical protein KJ630_07775 [Proteobacteria bacterium]|nr:hypothetical protein [Pseudomonadota bacterium]